MDVFRIDRNLIIRNHEVQFSTRRCAQKCDLLSPVCRGLGICKGFCERSDLAISIKSPTAVLLGHEMEGGRPWALGTCGCTLPQHAVELVLGQSQEIKGEVAWVPVYWRSGSCAVVVCGVAVAAMWLLSHAYLIEGW